MLVIDRFKRKTNIVVRNNQNLGGREHMLVSDPSVIKVESIYLVTVCDHHSTAE